MHNAYFTNDIRMLTKQILTNVVTRR